ncbi:MAG: hypothetical protein MK101_07460 [Phycisphaerales bacterium]|nr:hypothetical protein [Phycisphaerales bacterium]
MHRCCVLAAAALCAAATGLATADRVEAAREHLMRALTPTADNAQLGRLAALRALKDPALKPLFSSLVGHKQWPMQVHGVLGLTELEGHARTIELLEQIDARAREQAILVLLETDAIDDATLQSLQSLEGIEPHLEAQLVDRAITRGLPVEPATLERLLACGDPRAAGRSAMLLAARGMARALPALDGYIMQWEEPRQLEAAFAAMQTLQRHPSAEGARWVDDLLEAEARSGPRRFALMTLLQVDPALGGRRWSQAFEKAKRHRELVDLALIRLMSEQPFPTSARAIIEQESLLNCIADATDALAAPASGTSAALEALVASGHGRSIEWLLDRTPELDPETAQGAMERLIERVPISGEGSPSAIDQGVRASLHLHAIAPNRMRKLLGDAPDDSPRQVALLLAALQIDDAQLLSEGSSIRRIGLGQADALALLLQARWARTLDSSEMTALGLIMDGTRLSDSLRTQAAWLLIRHAGDADKAINALGLDETND